LRCLTLVLHPSRLCACERPVLRTGPQGVR
jgi:hypothetical protein